MSNPFFDHPVLNSPYQQPQRHWELDAEGQPTQQILELRRRAEFIAPIPKPKKRKGIAATQQQFVYDKGYCRSDAAGKSAIEPVSSEALLRLRQRP